MKTIDLSGKLTKVLQDSIQICYHETQKEKKVKVIFEFGECILIHI